MDFFPFTYASAKVMHAFTVTGTAFVLTFCKFIRSAVHCAQSLANAMV